MWSLRARYSQWIVVNHSTNFSVINHLELNIYKQVAIVNSTWMLQEPSVIVEIEYNHIRDASDSAVSLNST